MSLSVTFVGGPADMTRKIVQDDFPIRYINVPDLPDVCAYHDEKPPQRVAVNIEQYRVHRFRDGHAVAVWEKLR